VKRGQISAETWYHAAQPNVHSGKLVSPCKTAWCRQRIPRSLEQWSTCCTCSYWGNRSSVEGAAGRARRARVVLKLHREIRSRRFATKTWNTGKTSVMCLPCRAHPRTNCARDQTVARIDVGVCVRLMCTGSLSPQLPGALFQHPWTHDLRAKKSCIIKGKYQHVEQTGGHHF